VSFDPQLRLRRLTKPARVNVRRSATLTATVASSLFLAPAALAAGAPAPPVAVALHQRSGQPLSYFRLSARPGRPARVGTLELRNLRARTITVLLDPLGAVTASTLGSAYQLRGIAIRAPASWAKLPFRRVVLGPRRSAVVPISIDPPPSSAPGDYLSGIGVQALMPVTSRLGHGNVGISSVERYAIGLELRVPGPRHRLIRFSGAQVVRDPSGLSFLLLAGNLGNVILQNVSGSALITTGQKVVARASIGPGTFVTGTSIAYPVPTPSEHPAEGTAYRVRAVMRYAGGVARLDVQVRFGHRQALRQAAYDPGAPAVPGNGHVPASPVILGLLAGLGTLGMLGWKLAPRRGARPVRSPQRTLEALLAAARAGGQPLSMIIVSRDPSSERRVDLVPVLRPGLRVSDRLCRLDAHRYVVFAPDSDADTAAAIAADLTRRIERSDDAMTNHTAIDIETADCDESAEELLERIGRRRRALEPQPAG
jgi:hypothetical protein